jgi:hypothetical protein
VKWSGGVYAGLAAGIVATVLEIVLWSVFTDALPEILFRDARLAAAIVLGPRALAAPSTFEPSVMLVATLVHFALSAAYGLILSVLIGRSRALSSIVVGAGFGLLLYAVNMYGFTLVFPWFAATRDWITVAAHLTFGIAAAGAYRALAK